MNNLHEHYDQLTANEKRFVDHQVKETMAVAKHADVPLAGDDRCERAADALARWVIESRPRVLNVAQPEA